jgi:hypothetical protein
MAEAAAAAFQQRAFFDQAREAVTFELAAGLARPAVGEEAVAVGLLHRGDDARLEVQPGLADRGGVNHRTRFEKQLGIGLRDAVPMHGVPERDIHVTRGEADSRCHREHDGIPDIGCVD